jgi:hypothetical protein
MNRYVAITAIILVARTAAASAAVLGTMIKIALIISRPAMKYRNHWPSAIFSNVARFIAPAMLSRAGDQECRRCQRLQHPERDVKRLCLSPLLA